MDSDGRAAPSSTAADPAARSALRHRFENAEFDEARAELRVNGQLVSVEPRPLAVLSELLTHVNEVVTKEELMDGVWSGRPTVDHVLANAVSKLRAALGARAAARIVTVPRVGYRLDGPIDRIVAPAVQRLFNSGQAISNRESFVLERRLGRATAAAAGRCEVWLARHQDLCHHHVFKFANDSAQLVSLRREFKLYQVLRSELGPRDDFAQVLETQFAVAPYFLEYEYGGTDLLEWAETESQLATLSRDDRLDLFIQIARSAAAAHSVGVLHNDLKPTNVLVEGDSANPGAASRFRPRIRLTDFGSGHLLCPQLLERCDLTALGVSLAAGQDTDGASFMYLAPELATGAAPTVRCDVYSLGVLLCQLLLGDLRHPLSSGWQRQIGDALLVEDIESATDGVAESRLSSVDELISRLSRLDERRALRDERLRLDQEADRLLRESHARAARRPWLVAVVVGLAIGLVATALLYRRAEASRMQPVALQEQTQAVSDFRQPDTVDTPAVMTR